MSLAHECNHDKLCLLPAIALSFPQLQRSYTRRLRPTHSHRSPRFVPFGIHRQRDAILAQPF